MPSEFPFGTFANYSPRGTGKQSRRSRRICGNIKAGKVEQIEGAIPRLSEDASSVLLPFLSTEAVLVPVPRSAPLRDDALWPSKVISDVLVANGYGKETMALIDRVSAVKKSSTAGQGERPLVGEHMESMTVRSELIAPTTITLIDDVLTMGRTTYACASLLQDKFPEAKIRIFAMLRTLGMVDDIETVFDPTVGTITGYSSGKTYREP
ncbi:hypothetical protein ACS3SW_20725 [Roseobacteraceae bacterium S113]